MNIVVAVSWEAFNWWCKKHGIDPSDRRKALPLIHPTDRYRLYGRPSLRNAKLIVVGKARIDLETLEVFHNELVKYGFSLKENA